MTNIEKMLAKHVLLNTQLDMQRMEHPARLAMDGLAEASTRTQGAGNDLQPSPGCCSLVGLGQGCTGSRARGCAILAAASRDGAGHGGLGS